MPLPAIRAALLLPALAAAACVHLDSQGHHVREEHRFKVTADPDLRLTTFDGPIEIRSWDQPEVLVEVEKRGPTKESLDRIEVTVNQQGNRIELEARRPMTGESFIGIHVSPQVRYIVTMPRNAAIVARSGDGSIRIERISGKVELRTDDGSIRGDDVSGELTLTTGDGSVVLDDVNGSDRGQHERRWRERDGQAGERPRPHGGRIRHGARRAGQRDVGRLVAHHGRRCDRALSSRRLQR